MSNNIDFKKVGTELGLAMLGKADFKSTGRLESFNVESKNPFVKEASISLCRGTSVYLARMLEEGGNTASPDYEVLTKLAATAEWNNDLVEVLDPYLDFIVTTMEETKMEKQAFVKEALSPLSLAPAAAGKAMSYTPALIKGLLMLGVGTGAAAGAGYWGLKRNMQVDGDQKSEELKTKISEYDKMRSLLKQDISNKKIRSLDDLKAMANTY